jgi:hypothetical protein
MGVERRSRLIVRFVCSSNQGAWESLWEETSGQVGFGGG